MLERMEDSMNKSSSIKRIDKGTVHNICSGQVITSLRSAVKELVENSLDAGATSVEVHLYDHGTTSIEVIDNGAGIRAEDFEAVGLKHHTSKLREFADLPGVGTFGFRGEALGSLCALADVAMVTRHGAASVGTRLRFDADGRISQQTPAARQMGTTVTVRQLFSPLPVRRRQFCARARREVTDLLHLLWGYALVSDNVRLLCTQQCADGRRSVLLSSPAGAALPDRVSAVFGQKQAATLLPLRPAPPAETTRAEFSLSAAETNIDVTVEGLVSSCEHGKGRGAADRQFISINGRPCDHSKISRLANEVYRTYNRHQSPFLVLSVTLNREKVDVNVTPDKRMLFVQNEKYLLACVKETLTQCFESLPSSYKVTSLVPSQSPSSPSVTSSPCVTPSASPGDWISAIRRSVKKSAAPAVSAGNSKRQCLDRFFCQLPAPAPADGGAGGDGGSSCQPPLPPGRLQAPAPTSDEPGCSPTRTPAGDGAGGAAETVLARCARPQADDDVVCVGSAPVTGAAAAEPPSLSGTECLGRLGAGDSEGLHGAGDSGEGLHGAGDGSKGLQGADDDGEGLHGAGDGVQTLPGAENDTRGCLAAAGVSPNRKAAEATNPELLAADDATMDVLTADVTSISSPAAVERVISSDSGFAESSQCAEKDSSRRKRVRMSFSMDELRRQVADLETPSSESDDREQEWRFRATIKPADNQAAEEELNLQIKKEDFLKMRIVGQFNLGFLVARLGRDLFLIDQHASDEKFNFERLSQIPLAKQPLVVPQELELPAVSEETLLAQPDVFAAAGFAVAEDAAAPPGRRLRLLAAPAVQGVVCGKADLEELIWLVQESPGPLTALRPSRVRAVLASRACRSSLMIGTALSPAGMQRLVHNMAQMQHPWNCPHGRPTMRHLVCLSMLRP